MHTRSNLSLPGRVASRRVASVARFFVSAARNLTRRASNRRNLTFRNVSRGRGSREIVYKRVLYAQGLAFSRKLQMAARRASKCEFQDIARRNSEEQEDAEALESLSKRQTFAIINIPRSVITLHRECGHGGLNTTLGPTNPVPGKAGARIHSYTFNYDFRATRAPNSIPTLMPVIRRATGPGSVPRCNVRK